MNLDMNRRLSPDPPEVLSRVRDGLDLVDALASSVRTRAAPHFLQDELVSFGHEGLLAAARRFDPARGVPFLAWATRRVRGAMLDAVRARGGVSRRERLRSGDVAQAPMGSAPDPAESPENDAAQDLAADLDASSPETRLAEAQLHGAMRTSVASLPPLERKMLERMYFDDAPMTVVSTELGVSLSWASRLHARGVAKVRRELRRRLLVT